MGVPVLAAMKFVVLGLCSVPAQRAAEGNLHAMYKWHDLKFASLRLSRECICPVELKAIR